MRIDPNTWLIIRLVISSCDIRDLRDLPKQHTRTDSNPEKQAIASTIGIDRPIFEQARQAIIRYLTGQF